MDSEQGALFHGADRQAVASQLKQKPASGRPNIPLDEKWNYTGVGESRVLTEEQLRGGDYSDGPVRATLGYDPRALDVENVYVAAPSPSPVLAPAVAPALAPALASAPADVYVAPEEAYTPAPTSALPPTPAAFEEDNGSHNEDSVESDEDEDEDEDQMNVFREMMDQEEDGDEDDDKDDDEDDEDEPTSIDI